MQPDPQEVKIAHLIPQFYPRVGGAEVCVHNICRALAGMGHQAVVVTTSPPPAKAPDLPYHVEYLWEKTCGMFRRLPCFVGSAYLHHALAALQSKHHFDIWQVTNGWPLGVFAVDFFRKNRIPCLLRCCGDDIQTFPEINYGVRLDGRVSGLIEKKYPLYDAFIANSASMRSEYERIGIPSAKIKTIPNGVDIKRFSSSAPEERLNGTTTLLTVGRNHPKKGFSIIPEIAGVLKEHGMDFTWVLAGRGNSSLLDEGGELPIRVVEDCGESEEKGLELPSEKLISLYRNSDIFVFPSLMEGYPTVCIEAMAAGLPVIASDSPGVRDVVRDGMDGIIVKKHGAGEYASAIISLVKDENAIGRMRKAARDKAAGQDWTAIGALYVDTYSELLTRKS